MPIREGKKATISKGQQTKHMEKFIPQKLKTVDQFERVYMFKTFHGEKVETLGQVQDNMTKKAYFKRAKLKLYD